MVGIRRKGGQQGHNYVSDCPSNSHYALLQGPRVVGHVRESRFGHQDNLSHPLFLQLPDRQHMVQVVFNL